MISLGNCDAELIAQAGALVVAIAFFAMFVARETPTDILRNYPPPKAEEQLSDADMQKRQEAILRVMTFQLAVARREKVYLAVLSVTGTLLWAFGEDIASWGLPLLSPQCQ